MTYADVETDAIDQLLREREYGRVKERCRQVLDAANAPAERREAAELALAQCHVEEGDVAAAAQIVVRVIQATPDSWRAWHVNALIAFSQSDWMSARECYRRAEALAPDSDWVLLGLGLCEANAGARASAREYFSRALSANPASAPALQGLLSVCDLESDARDILTPLKNFLALMPLDATARLCYAKALRAAGQSAEALSEVLKVTFMKPDFEEAARLRDQLRGEMR